MYKKTITFLSTALVCLTLTGGALAQTTTNPEEAARAQALDVVHKTQDVERALQLHSREVSSGASATGSTTLATASSDALKLDAAVMGLKRVMGDLSTREAEAAREVIREAETKIAKLDETLTWDAQFVGTTTTAALIEHCKGFGTCLLVWSGCTGCFKYTDGLTEGTCFDPCPDD